MLNWRKAPRNWTTGRESKHVQRHNKTNKSAQINSRALQTHNMSAQITASPGRGPTIAPDESDFEAKRGRNKSIAHKNLESTRNLFKIYTVTSHFIRTSAPHARSSSARVSTRCRWLTGQTMRYNRLTNNCWICCLAAPWMWVDLRTVYLA